VYRPLWPRYWPSFWFGAVSVLTWRGELPMSVLTWFGAAIVFFFVVFPCISINQNLYTRHAGVL
jgi:hypothetical protein